MSAFKIETTGVTTKDALTTNGDVTVERTGKTYGFKYYNGRKSNDGNNIVILYQHNNARVPETQLRDVRNAIRHHFETIAANVTEALGDAVFEAVAETGKAIIAADMAVVERLTVNCINVASTHLAKAAIQAARLKLDEIEPAWKGTLRERAVNRFMLAHVGMTGMVNSSLRVWKSRGRRMVSVSCVIAGETRRIDYDYDLKPIVTREARRAYKALNFHAAYGGNAPGVKLGEHMRDNYEYAGAVTGRINAR